MYFDFQLKINQVLYILRENLMMRRMRHGSKINPGNKIQKQIMIQLFSKLITKKIINRENERKIIEMLIMIFENMDNIFKISLSEHKLILITTLLF